MSIRIHGGVNATGEKKGVDAKRRVSLLFNQPKKVEIVVNNEGHNQSINQWSVVNGGT